VGATKQSPTIINHQLSFIIYIAPPDCHGQSRAVEGQVISLFLHFVFNIIFLRLYGGEQSSPDRGILNNGVHQKIVAR
jgi:hypothetical protein